PSASWFRQGTVPSSETLQIGKVAQFPHQTWTPSLSLGYGEADRSTPLDSKDFRQVATGEHQFRGRRRARCRETSRSARRPHDRPPRAPVLEGDPRGTGRPGAERPHGLAPAARPGAAALKAIRSTVTFDSQRREGPAIPGRGVLGQAEGDRIAHAHGLLAAVLTREIVTTATLHL